MNHRVNTPVVLVPYDSTWPDAFGRLAAAIRKALPGEELTLHHIGSTAVPGMRAKDVLDVQIGVQPNRLDTVAIVLAASGWTTVPGITSDHMPAGSENDPVDWEKRFLREQTGARRCHLHIRRIGAANYRFPLLVRDFLRKQAYWAQSYEAYKVASAEALPEAAIYASVKESVHGMLWLSAKTWAENTSWCMPESDG